MDIQVVFRAFRASLLRGLMEIEGKHTQKRPTDVNAWDIDEIGGELINIMVATSYTIQRVESEMFDATQKQSYDMLKRLKHMYQHQEREKIIAETPNHIRSE